MEELASSEFSLRFTIAYAIGLAPGLLLRFAWKRGPIEPSLATSIAIISCFGLFLVSRALIAPGDPAIMQSGLMWGVLVVVNRAVMMWGYDKRASSSS